jgi:uncharacterized membrane protein
MIVASYPSYREAEEAVARLAEADFPVEHVSIVGRGLQMVEQVTGRYGWADALIRGMFAGALAGVLMGWLFGVFDWFNPVVAAAWLALDGFWFGALVGSLVGVIMWAITRKRKEFESIGGLVAERYELLVDDDFAADAQRILAGTPASAEDRAAEAAHAS